MFPETLAARVIAEANNAPALVQLFAGKLLARLRETPRTLPYEITREDVAEVWRDQKLVDGFQKRFDYTLTLDKRYKVIAYTVALHALDDGADEALTVRQLREECRYWWARGFENCSGDDFRSLLDECVNLGVLGVDDGRYRLRTRTCCGSSAASARSRTSSKVPPTSTTPTSSTRTPTGCRT